MPNGRECSRRPRIPSLAGASLETTNRSDRVGLTGCQRTSSCRPVDTSMDQRSIRELRKAALTDGEIYGDRRRRPVPRDFFVMRCMGDSVELSVLIGTGRATFAEPH